MTESEQAEGAQPAGIEYLGTAGATQDCADAVEGLLLAGRKITEALILTFRGTGSDGHALLLRDCFNGEIAIKSGFSSGYGGTGPFGFSATLGLLQWHGVELDEVEIDEAMMERIDQAALSMQDLATIRASRRLRPSRLWDYVRRDDYALETRNPWRDRRPQIPWPIIDDRLGALALKFWDDPDSALFKGHRQLEIIVSERAGLSRDEAAKGPMRVYAAAFNGEGAPLTWPELHSSECVGRANLFIGCVGAHRNVRAHRADRGDPWEQLSEFLLLNHLYRLEATAVSRAHAIAEPER